jgi:ferredoxin--NADP+ reductase
MLNELVEGKLRLYDTATREDFQRMGRITDLIKSGKFFKDMGVEPINPETDRVMICGSNAMIKDVADLMKEAGLTEGSNAQPAEFVIEKAFVG